MSDITIVTAFFDIGRGEWTPEKGYPHYLQRSTDTYFERFAHMAKLENPMVIYTEPKFKERILELRGERKTHIVEISNFKCAWDLEIKKIQNSEYFKKLINKSQIKNPEYWNEDYVGINWYKSIFVDSAYLYDYIDTKFAAWLDFGYCRSEDTLNGLTEWKYDFDEEKIHVWSINDLPEKFSDLYPDCVINNKVYITGPAIVATKEKWEYFFDKMFETINFIINDGIVDDDQGLMAIVCFKHPKEFEIHKLKNDWFVIFKEYSE